MSTLDNPNMTDPSTVSYAKMAFNQGAIGAGVLIAIGLVFNLTGLVEPGQSNAMAWIANLINLGVIAYFIYTATNKHKNEDLGGYISYGRAFGVGAVVVLAITLISIVWTYIYMGFIDPGSMDMAREAALEQMINQQGMSESEAEEALAMTGFMFNPVAISIMAGLFLGFFGLIIDAVVAAVVKKDNPAFA